jgi:SAM-dependent methyltransferase
VSDRAGASLHEGGSLDEYFAGRKLLGDDFSPAQIEGWFAQERDAYAELGGFARNTYRYYYHALNRIHGFRHLPVGRRFPHALSVGGAFGDEALPVLERIDRLTILDSSTRYEPHQLGGVPVEYERARPDGQMPISDDTFDLLLCFGVLQYVPNVSTVVEEFLRVLRPGGYALLREVTTSLGDWRRPRKGLSRCERGVPLPILRGIVRGAGFEVMHETRCMFPPLGRLAFRLGLGYNSAGVVALDRLACKLFGWNQRYHATHSWQKFRPTSVFLVLRRP